MANAMSVLVDKQDLFYTFHCENAELRDKETTYLNILKETLTALLPNVERSTVRKEIYVRPISQRDEQSKDSDAMNSCVAMKSKEFFAQTFDLSWKVMESIRFNIKANTKLTEEQRTFVFTVFAYACQHAHTILFSLRPRDFLIYLIELHKSVDVLAVLTYAFYDMFWSTLSFLRLKTRSIRQVIVPKEKTATKPKRRLYVTVSKRDAMFESNVITELVLQLIEKGVIRCSSIAKCFLVTCNQAVFYKYCLIRGKVCLKAIRDAVTIRI